MSEDYRVRFDEAMCLLKEKDSIKTLKDALFLLNNIPLEIMDVSKEIVDCQKRMNNYERFYTAKNLSVQDDIEELAKAINLLNDFDYEGVDELKVFCVQKKEKLEKEKESNNLSLYNECLELVNSNDFNKLEEAIEKISDLRNYRNGNELYLSWINKRRLILYNEALSLMENKNVESYEEACKKLNKIKGYEDALTLYKVAQKERDSIIIDGMEKRKWKRKAFMALVFCIVVICLLIFTLI